VLTNLMKLFRVSQLDHVEVFVPDRYEAAEWYRRTLGLDIVPRYQKWAANPRGPLMISSDDGSTKLALFEGQPQESGQTSGWHLVAFRVDADGFLEFVTRLADRPLMDDQRRTVTVESVVDHEEAYSVYFSDPYGNRLELTTYDYEATRAGLTQLRTRSR
jgi:catechol 2,3-dioxygenase-like lactoylglutathione lyase family enzyme